LKGKIGRSDKYSSQSIERNKKIMLRKKHNSSDEYCLKYIDEC
jgi:hypothetical protein